MSQHDAHVSDWFDWSERAAILEYDGGLSRAKAERLATLRWHKERKAMR